MFKVKTIGVTDRSCPRGHAIGNGRMPQNWKIDPKYCQVCGARLNMNEESCDVALCAHCNNLVDPNWQHCPYCGV